MSADTITPSAPLSLRLSVTDRCNFRCSYCQPVGISHRVLHSALPSLEMLAETVRWLKDVFNITKVRLTGGEPLLRRGIGALIENLAAPAGIADLSMTTNGSLLQDFSEPLQRAGLKRLNVSLDTLNPQRFADLTGGRLSDTLEGINTAKMAGLNPIKLNAVLRKSAWQEDVPELLDYAANHGFEIRFIELMRMGTAAEWAQREFISAALVQEYLKEQTLFIPIAGDIFDTARRNLIFWRGRKITVGWITPHSERFCGGCNRLRLDCQGRLRRCLMDSTFFPLTDCLAGMKSEEVEQMVRDYVSAKQPPLEMQTVDPMVAVGG